MHHPTDRIAHTTAFVTPVVEHWLEREIAQWVYPMTTHRTMSERSYHGATSRSQKSGWSNWTLYFLLLSDQYFVSNRRESKTMRFYCYYYYYY